MALFYLHEPALQRERNANGTDYTPAYLPAMLAFMGMTATAIPPEALPTLDAQDALLIGADHDALPTTAAACITLGCNAEAPLRERRIFATYTSLRGDAIPLFVPVVPALVAGDVVLATATDAEGNTLPALVRRGEGYCYFFDVAATLWFSGDGFSEMQNAPYFPLGRTPDWRPLPNGSEVFAEQPYNDLLLTELETLLRRRGVPSLYRLPPTSDGTVPDLALHFSGDDDCCSATINRNAAARMKQLGLPYHINAMPNGAGAFCFDAPILRELQANGCELGLHPDLTCVPYTEETVRAQYTAFRETFDLHPVTGVNHCLVQNGPLAEFLRWLQGCDIIADNGYLGIFNAEDINAFDLMGFGYGTSFPRFTCDDAAHGNALLSTMSIPLTYYEARLPREDSDTGKVLRYLDGAAANARIAQFFFHPHYLNDDNDNCPAALRVLSLIQKHVAAKGYLALPMTTNTIAQFWKARAEATLTQQGNVIRIETPVAVLLRLAAPTDNATLDGKPATVTQKQVEGDVAYLVAVPAGKHEVII